MNLVFSSRNNKPEIYSTILVEDADF